MTIVYSCLCFASISRGLMTKPAGFLRVPPLKLGEQIVWFFSFLISLLFVPLFQYIFVYGFIYYSLIVIMGIFLARALQILIFFLILSYQESAQIPRRPALTHTAEHKRPSHPPPTKKTQNKPAELPKHSAEPLNPQEKIKSSPKSFKSPVTCFCRNTAHAAPISHGNTEARCKYIEVENIENI